MKNVWGNQDNKPRNLRTKPNKGVFPLRVGTGITFLAEETSIC